MQTQATTVESYLEQIPPERQNKFNELRSVIKKHLPEGFEESFGYGMIGYVVPHSLYPAGYHCNPKTPLPFLSIASQKNFIAIYHMGMYADEKLLNSFLEEYPKYVKTKPDMGKSCIRFKKPDMIPMELIGQLCEKMTPRDWIDKYEKMLNR